MSIDLSNGSIFAGRYRIERRIATGGMGAVYEVVHLETNRKRALKVMHENFVQSDELRGRFRQEARVAAEIESEYIVDVFDAGIDEATGMPFLVMELLRGEELGKRLRRSGPFSPADVVLYLHQTSLALDKTHRASIVHRDLKPDNLFLCEREDGAPRIKVLDFGIAKMVADGSTQANATRSLGTPLYMSPEQFLMDAGVSPATDIFALGMIAFTLLVGKPYWNDEAKSGASVFAFAANAALGPKEAATARASRLGGNLPPAFDPWFAQATAKNPSERFRSASEAVRGLAEALGVPLPGGQLGSGVFGPASIPRPPVIAPPMGPPPGLNQTGPGGPPSQTGQTGRQPMPSWGSIPSMTPAPGPTSTPFGQIATPIDSGVTAAPASKPRSSRALIGAGASLAAALVAIVLYMALSDKPDPPPPAAAATTSAPPAVDVTPPPRPIETLVPEPAASASAAAAPSTTTSKTTSTTKTTTTKVTTPPAGTTKKPLWTND